jgi:hypothetical protein
MTLQSVLIYATAMLRRAIIVTVNNGRLMKQCYDNLSTAEV